MKKLYLIRHGLAEDAKLQNAYSDSLRELTSEGKTKSLGMAKKLHTLEEEIQGILHSPYARASQTAGIFHQVFSKAKIKVTEHLAPYSNFEGIVQELNSWDKLESIALVGHEPFLSGFSSFLLGNQEKTSLQFKKSGVACFVKENSNSVWSLKFFVYPKIFLPNN